MSVARRAELAANLGDVQARIARACAAAGRDPAELTMIAVTKTWPASDIRLLAGLGVTEVGENRDQEAAGKHAESADLGLRWHFVGQLQTNKCRSVARYADVVHSVDRPSLVTALDRAAETAGRVITVLIQVSLDEVAEARRGGVRPAGVADLAAALTAAGSLELGGVMAVAPPSAAPAPAFARLAEIAALLQRDHPDATMISAGMTGDLEAAVATGATHLRIGTALLGGRAAVLG
jgi:hypothetical protein